MKANFKQLALDVTTLSHLMKERNKVLKEELMKRYPDGVTITGIDFVPDEHGELYSIAIIAEDDSVFFNGGCVMNRIAEEWQKAYDGDIDLLNKDLKESGGVKIKMEQGKTKQNRSITLVHIV